MKNQKERPWYFNLIKDGDSAIVRVLHSSTATIEKVTSHKIELDGKKRRVKCLIENCPLCTYGNKAEERVYIHLFDYTDNKEKVWERTDKIIPQLDTVTQDWGKLSDAVIKITRKGDAFPKYEIAPINPALYQAVDTALVDEQVASRYSYSRKAEDIVTFIQTGKFPERAPYVPKDQYAKQVSSENPSSAIPQAQAQVQSNESNNTFSTDDPFVGGVFNNPPRRV